MIKHFYKDIILMADIFEFHDGRRFAISWAKGVELVETGKFPADLANAPGGMQYVAEHHPELILKYGEKI